MSTSGWTDGHVHGGWTDEGQTTTKVCCWWWNEQKLFFFYQVFASATRWVWVGTQRPLVDVPLLQGEKSLLHSLCEIQYCRSRASCPTPVSENFPGIKPGLELKQSSSSVVCVCVCVVVVVLLTAWSPQFKNPIWTLGSYDAVSHDDVRLTSLHHIRTATGSGRTWQVCWTKDAC